MLNFSYCYCHFKGIPYTNLRVLLQYESQINLSICDHLQGMRIAEKSCLFICIACSSVPQFFENRRERLANACLYPLLWSYENHWERPQSNCTFSLAVSNLCADQHQHAVPQDFSLYNNTNTHTHILRTHESSFNLLALSLCLICENKVTSALPTKDANLI